jgi:hypothetical protein
MRVFENRLLRIIFGLKRDEVIGGWTKVHNEELHNLYYLSNVIRLKKSRRACSTHGEKMNVCRVLVRNPEENCPVRRPRRR